MSQAHCKASVMPAVLTDHTICDPNVPSAWAPMLECLQEFLDLEQAMKAEGEPAAAPSSSGALEAVHQRLLDQSPSLLEPAALAEFSEAELERAFARSVLFLLHLKECVAAGQGVLDTAGSRTLGLYECDFFSSDENVARLRDGLRRAVRLRESDLAALEEEVGLDLADATRKQRLVAAIRAEFDLSAASPHLKSSIHRFFQFIYLDAPLAADEIQLIVTGTLIFFCIPFRGNELLTDRFLRATAEQRDDAARFLAKIQRFTQQRFASFPAFGYVEADRLDPAILGRLAARAGMEPQEVLAELSRLITILPLDEVDKYVVHDVWGHGWQASMLRFENLYQEMAEFGDPLDLSESAEDSAASPWTFGACFRGVGDALTLDAAQFEAFAQREVCQRLPVALSGVLAEMMADVAEYKLIAEHYVHADLLPSSSLFKGMPTKLDLTLADVKFYFSQATKVFRRWATEPSRHARTVNQLVSRGGSHAAAEAAVAEAVRIWNGLAEDMFSPQLAWQRASHERLRVNAFVRVALNFVGIHRAVLETYRSLENLPVGGLPLKSFRDLLVLGASVFFERNPARNLWRVDEYLSLFFVPACRRLASC